MRSKKLIAYLKRIKARITEFDKKLEAGHKPLIIMVFTIILCVGVIVLRKQQAFTNPQFWAEDGTVWFRQAYDNGIWHTLFVPYSGTISIITRIVGYLATLVPLLYAPLVFNIASLTGQLLAVFIITSSRLKHIVNSRFIAILASVMYVCITNSDEVFVNLANIQWHLGLASFLILISSKPKTLAWKIFDLTLLSLSGLTGPLSIMLAPVAFLIWFKGRGRAAFRNFTIIALAALIQLASLLIIDSGQRGGHAAVSFTNAVKMLVGQVFTSGVTGVNYIYTFYNNFTLYIALGVAIAIIIYAVRKGPSWIAYANLFALTVFISMLASLKPVKGTDLWAVLTQPGAGQRYWYIPVAVWLFTLLWSSLDSKSVIIRLVCWPLLIIFVFVGVPGSWTIAPRPDKNFKYYSKQFEALPKGHRIKIPINPDWGLFLKKH